MWICCGLYSKSTTSPHQIEIVEFGFRQVVLELRLGEVYDYGYVGSELSVGWIDPRVGLGWVGLGREWVENLCFSGLGWVMGLKWQMCEKYITDTRSTLSAEKVESVELVRWGCVQA